jgi:oxygen-independent coproporphyrinogen-3 oxidase
MVGEEKFGIYVHIPYCLQRCIYCDFATYEEEKILPKNEYLKYLTSEIESRASIVPYRKAISLYFGGGTPSLLQPEQILMIKNAFVKAGFVFSPDCEITLEINPATLNADHIESLLKIGVNRFSVGAQTFDDDQLKRIGRKHTSQQTIETLNLLKTLGVNYSFDLLFALPSQSRDDLQKDLDLVGKFSPNHVSPYCLTVPANNPLFAGQPKEEEQVEMFSLIWSFLESENYINYEISNFSKVGFESQHNLLYWSDDPYWGVGLSSHSYFKNEGWGKRFWNPKNIDRYVDWVQSGLDLPQDHFEELQLNQSLSDFCHTSLRTKKGLDLVKLEAKYGATAQKLIKSSLQKLENEGLLERANESVCRLTRKGILLSNKVFEDLTFI